VWGLRHVPAAHASTLTLLEPLVSIMLAASLLGESLNPRAGIGGALILAGSLVVMTAPPPP
jgi:drug/metabolite transporter (DMT)-like permease